MYSSLSWTPNLFDAIDSKPLVVPPDLPLSEAIALISQAHYPQCSLVDNPEQRDAPRTSCALIVDDDQTVLGILTERDVVRLTAKAVNFSQLTVADVMVQPVVTLSLSAMNDVFAALFMFRRYRIRHLPITNDAGVLIGVMTHESVRQSLRPANLLQFRRVADVMITDVVHASTDTSIFQLAWLMAEHQVSCVVITIEHEEGCLAPVGIVTERDIVQYQFLNLDLKQTRAETVMSAPLFLLSPQDSLWAAHQEMQKRRVGRLVVSWNWGQGLGIVTQTSLLRVFDPLEMYGVIENLQQTIATLKMESSVHQRPRHANAPSQNAQTAHSQASKSQVSKSQVSKSHSVAHSVWESNTPQPHGYALSRPKSEKIQDKLFQIASALQMLASHETPSETYQMQVAIAQNALQQISEAIALQQADAV